MSIDLLKTLLHFNSYENNNYYTITSYLPTQKINTFMYAFKYFYSLNKNDIIPNDTTSLIFDLGHNIELSNMIIPNSVNNISLSFHYNKPLKQGDIKNNIIILKFGYKFNHKIEPGVLPNSLKYLNLCGEFNQKLKIGSIPNNVECLIFSNHFNNLNHKLKNGIIPSSVTYLEFGDYFNQELEPGDIPNGVISLIFGKNYCKKIKPGVIPDSVIYLEIKGEFNHPLDETNLPKSLLFISIAFENYSYKININKNIIISNIKCGSIYYYDNNIIFDGNKQQNFRYYIHNFFKNKLIYNNIFKELIKELLNPDRLKQISEKNGITINELINILY